MRLGGREETNKDVWRALTWSIRRHARLGNLPRLLNARGALVVGVVVEVLLAHCSLVVGS
jgi:hypothetical protein